MKFPEKVLSSILSMVTYEIFGFFGVGGILDMIFGMERLWKGGLKCFFFVGNLDEAERLRCSVGVPGVEDERTNRAEGRGRSV